MDEHDLRRTQDFRDMMIDFAGETRTDLKLLREDMRELKTTGCAMGQRHSSDIEWLKTDSRDQWDGINALRKPTKRAAIWTGGAVGLSGLVWVVVEIVKALTGKVPP